MADEAIKYLHVRDGSAVYVFREQKGYSMGVYDSSDRVWYSRRKDATKEEWSIMVGHCFHKRYLPAANFPKEFQD